MVSRDRLLQQTILVVDDDRELAATIGEFLEREGYAVRLAHTGDGARRLLRESPVALVVLDLVLPDLDALELMKDVLQTDPTPEVVIVTGHATVDSAVAAVEAGAAGYLIKPFALPRLATLVGRALERQGLERENLRLTAELSDRLAEAESLLAVARTVASTGRALRTMSATWPLTCSEQATRDRARPQTLSPPGPPHLGGGRRW